MSIKTLIFRFSPSLSPPNRAIAASAASASASLLLVAGTPAGVPFPSFKSASFFLKTGQIWHDIGRFDLAAACFERATDLTSSVEVTTDLTSSVEGAPDASKLLGEALDLCEKGIAAAAGHEIQALEGLKQRCLRFMMAERLQVEDYDGVLKCVRVLRGGGEGKGEDHPGVGYVAMKAWIGVGRIGEAEKELKGMMANKEVPESVCLSAAETYLAVAGLEAARGVLMGLVGRCRDGAGAALRVVQLVAGDGGGRGAVGAKVVAELVSDERVAALFEGAAATKEREVMHAILWN